MFRKAQVKEVIAVQLSLSTIYLLPCEGGYLQIDTGYEKDFQLYQSQLQKLQISLEQIQLLVLTHHHDDHSGFLNNLTRGSDLRIIAHEKSVPLLQSGENDKSRGGGYVSKLVSVLAGLKMRLDPDWTLSFPSFDLREKDILVSKADDHVLREFGVPGKIIPTPGHCIDHLSLVLDRGAAFVGDATADMMRWAGTKYCTVFMTDMPTAYQSWDRLLEAGSKEIFPAHGKPFSAEKLRNHRGRISNQDLIPFF